MILIDKESLIEHMRKAYKGNTKAGFKWDLISAVVVIEAEEEITPDAERQGHWEKIETSKIYDCQNTMPIYKCSFCHTLFVNVDLKDRYHYCPHCGALMNQEVEEEMKTCDKCEYCYEQSNHNRNARIHTIRFICMMNRNHPSKEVIKAGEQAIQLVEKKTEGVNPDDTCELWEERKGKMKIKYKDGEIGEVEE